MAQPAEKPLLTLTEVASRTKVSMPTLQRYKKLYQDRIPSVGKGRKQRYPEEALAVFLQLKKENLGRRGRPRKNAQRPAEDASKAAAAPKKAAKAKKAVKAKSGSKAESKKPAGKAGDDLLTLTQIQNLTGISYPTLLRYVKTHAKDIPHQGTGRSRRFKPEAVDVFKTIRSQSKRGRKPKAKTAKAAAGRPAAKAAAKTGGRRRGRPPKVVEPTDLLARIVELEKSHRQLERVIAKQQKRIEKPFRVLLTR